MNTSAGSHILLISVSFAPLGTTLGTCSSVTHISDLTIQNTCKELHCTALTVKKEEKTKTATFKNSVISSPRKYDVEGQWENIKMKG